jgi:hypothetical protein
MSHHGDGDRLCTISYVGGICIWHRCKHGAVILAVFWAMLSYFFGIEEFTGHGNVAFRLL